MNYDTVVAKMLENPVGILDDFLYEAGLGDDPVQWAKVRDEVEYDLMPKRSLRDLVGQKVFPAEGRKVEKWARGVEQMKPRIRRHVRGYLYSSASNLIARSSSLPSNSPRRLSDDLCDKLGQLAGLTIGDVSERGAKVIWEALECAMRDGRESASLLHERRDAFEAMRETVRETATAMLQIASDNPEPPRSNANGQDHAKN
jgi:hypothetical protein